MTQAGVNSVMRPLLKPPFEIGRLRAEQRWIVGLVILALCFLALASSLLGSGTSPQHIFPSDEDALRYLSYLRNLTLGSSCEHIENDEKTASFSEQPVTICITILSEKSRAQKLPATLASLFRYISINDMLRTRIVVMPIGLPNEPFAYDELVRSLSSLGVRMVDVRSFTPAPLVSSSGSNSRSASSTASSTPSIIAAFEFAQQRCTNLLLLQEGAIALRPFLEPYRHWTSTACPNSPTSAAASTPSSSPAAATSPAPLSSAFLASLPPDTSTSPRSSCGLLARKPSWFWAKLHFFDHLLVYSPLDYAVLGVVGLLWTAAVGATWAVIASGSPLACLLRTCYFPQRRQVRTPPHPNSDASVASPSPTQPPPSSSPPHLSSLTTGTARPRWRLRPCYMGVAVVVGAAVLYLAAVRLAGVATVTKLLRGSKAGDLQPFGQGDVMTAGWFNVAHLAEATAYLRARQSDDIPVDRLLSEFARGHLPSGLGASSSTFDRIRARAIFLASPYQFGFLPPQILPTWFQHSSAGLPPHGLA